MNVQPIDLRDEIRQGVQSRFDFAPVVICRPIASERLSRRELYSLRSVCNCFSFRPLRCVDTPAQFSKFRLRKLLSKGPNRILVRCLLDASLCSTSLGHWCSSLFEL